MKKILLFLLSFSLPLFATPQVVVSIKPLNDIALAVMEGVGRPTLLVPANSSPHAYSLSPSQAKALHEADLIVWIGPGLETFLIRPIKRAQSSTKVLSLIELPGMILYPTLGDDEHEHGPRDPHLWLDPENLKTYAQALAKTLSELDPEHAKQYQANAKTLNQSLTRLDQTLSQELKPLTHIPIMVFHDAYQYFEKRYHLDIKGVVLEQPEIMPSVAKLLEIQQTLKADKIQCIFSEPQFKPAIVDRLVAQSGAKAGVLDPLGAAEPQGLAGTQALFNNLAKGLLDCSTR